MESISISTGCFSGAPNALELTLELARELRTGVEWQPGLKDVGIEAGVTSLHAAWGTRLEQEHALHHEGLTQSLKARYFAPRLGTVESNPCLSIAGRQRLPVVVHHGTVAEAHGLASEGRIGVWESLGALARHGLLLVENDERAIYPWKSGRRSSFTEYLRVLGMARLLAPTARLCLDVGHLVLTDGGEAGLVGPMTRALEVVAAGDQVELAQLHLHDVVEGVDHMAFGPKTFQPLRWAISQAVGVSPGVSLVVEVGSISAAIRHRLLGRKATDRTADDVRRSVDFVRGVVGQ